MFIKTGDAGSRKSKIKIINSEEIIEKKKGNKDKEEPVIEEPKSDAAN